MKKITLLLFLLLGIIATQEINAKGVIVYHNGIQLETVEKLPDDARLDDGTHVNIGIMYDQFGLFWMPVWNYGETRYVLISDNEKTYWLYSDSEIEEIAESYDIKLNKTPTPSLWNKIGLKPIVIILILFIICSYIPSKEKTEEQDSRNA